MKKYLFLIFIIPAFVQAQKYNYTTIDSLDKSKFVNEHPYEVRDYAATPVRAKKAKNIIFLIGDGMGGSHVYAGLIANRGNLYLRTMPFSGFNKTNSSDKLITDSAAGATAFSAGVKTHNGAIGVDSADVPVRTILEMAEEKGLSSGLVSTSRITHATPASFIAHQPSRGMYDEIAADFLKTDIDVFIGGGRSNFDSLRKDGHSLLPELKAKGYEIITDVNALQDAKGDKIAGLVGEGHLKPVLLGRGDMLMQSTRLALKVLSRNENGFFLMVEGSQIDWGGHDNNVPYIVTEMLDFDQVIGEVLKFAAEDGETLVVVTADHETGGFAITGGSIEQGIVEGQFTTHSHTGVMVPVFAYGPGADLFTGIMENTDIFNKFIEALDW